ncbi:DEKNAAC100828 [Brettanomyces naardenensis]|uniref:DEKNAAC100828 n=1 Tax=Brettanomyces naardenensis TaxID=13370 RepID=A0A448YEY0_BRENA|nr:DEKNAAC100828 [Brettanomyces naardenensis]
MFADKTSQEIPASDKTGSKIPTSATQLGDKISSLLDSGADPEAMNKGTDRVHGYDQAEESQPRSATVNERELMGEYNERSPAELAKDNLNMGNYTYGSDAQGMSAGQRGSFGEEKMDVDEPDLEGTKEASKVPASHGDGNKEEGGVLSSIVAYLGGNATKDDNGVSLGESASSGRIPLYGSDQKGNISGKDDTLEDPFDDCDMGQEACQFETNQDQEHYRKYHMHQPGNQASSGMNRMMKVSGGNGEGGDTTAGKTANEGSASARVGESAALSTASGMVGGSMMPADTGKTESRSNDDAGEAENVRSHSNRAEERGYGSSERTHNADTGRRFTNRDVGTVAGDTKEAQKIDNGRIGTGSKDISSKNSAMASDPTYFMHDSSGQQPEVLGGSDKNDMSQQRQGEGRARGNQRMQFSGAQQQHESASLNILSTQGQRQGIVDEQSLRPANSQPDQTAMANRVNGAPNKMISEQRHPISGDRKHQLQEKKSRSELEQGKKAKRKGLRALFGFGKKSVEEDTGKVQKGTVYEEVHSDNLEHTQPHFKDAIAKVFGRGTQRGEEVQEDMQDHQRGKAQMSGMTMNLNKSSHSETRSLDRGGNPYLTSEENNLARNSAKAALENRSRTGNSTRV